MPAIDHQFFIRGDVMPMMKQNFVFIFIFAIPGFCESCAQPAPGRPDHFTTATVSTEAQAVQRLIDSGYLEMVRSRLGEPSGLRYSLESQDRGAFRFWVYEDRETHAATIDRVKVMPSGKLFLLNVATDEWVAFGH